jgi:hypothetical protein
MIIIINIYTSDHYYKYLYKKITCINILTDNNFCDVSHLTLKWLLLEFIICSKNNEMLQNCIGL